MTELLTTVDHRDGTAQPDRPFHRKEKTVLLLHEALARSRMREAEQAAREYRLARSMTAGRRWSQLARYAVGRADRAVLRHSV